jgi:hypothetical protein
MIYQAFGGTALCAPLGLPQPTGKGKMSKRNGGNLRRVQSIYALDLKPLGYLPERWTTGWR